jgi:CoA:oxalate CoA-transferase
MVRPLDGIRVLDLSRVVSGPFAGRMLSDLGADVVKIEPPEGDVTRFWGEKRHGISGFFQQQNAGKRNVCVDLRSPGSVELVIALAAQCDIVLENFRAGVMDRLGLGWTVLSAVNPRLIMCAISGFGQTGPDSGRAAYAPVVEAEVGFVKRQADLDEAPPTDPVLSIADYNAGLHGLVGVLAALHMRSVTGMGTFLDLSMVDAMLATDDYLHNVIDGYPLERLGGDYWRTADGDWLMIASQLKAVFGALNRRAGLVDPTPPGADLDTKVRMRREAVRQWVLSFPTTKALTDALDGAGLAWGQLRSDEHAINSPTALAHGIVASVDDRGGGRRGVVQSPYRFSNAESGVRGGAAHRGEHNAEVLAEWLGHAPEDIAALVRSGALPT